MQIHLTASTKTLIEDYESLRRIREQINYGGHTLLKDWLTKARKRISQNMKHDPATIFRENMELVSKADTIIAEVTHDSFGVGYQVATGVQLNKPILLLSRKGYNGTMMRGLETSLVSFKEYDDNNLEHIISNFLAFNNITAKDLRFNFFIDREIYNYLRWMSYKTGSSKSKILRDVIRKEVEKPH